MTRPSPSSIPLRGRGTSLNPANRFEPIHLEVLPEHARAIAVDHPKGVAVPTRVFKDHARTLINPVNAPDLSFRWSINPYRGCEHACIYCYARPTHETFGLSCGTDFETNIFAKVDAPSLFRRELARPSWKGEHIMLSGVTDPYQPVERSLRITRSLLEIACECSQPLSFITKNSLITRDLDLLEPMARRGCAQVAVSITTLDNALAGAMEPRASSPRARLRTIESLSARGVPVTVMVAPVIPGLNDHEIPAILDAAAEAGATAASMILLRLPLQVADLFEDWLSRHRPDRLRRVLSLLRQARNGHLDHAPDHGRFTGSGALAEQLTDLFRLARRRAGLRREGPALDSSRFVHPDPDGAHQMKLFGDNPVDDVDDRAPQEE